LRGGCKLFLISYAELCVCVFDPAADFVQTNKRRQIYDIAEGLERGRGEINWKHTENERKESTGKYTQETFRTFIQGTNKKRVS